MADEKRTVSSAVTLVVATAVLGVLTGFSSLLLGLFLDFVEELFLGYCESNAYPAPIDALPVVRFASILVGGIIVATIWFFLQRKGRLTGIDAALQGKKMSPLKTAAHDLTQIFYVACGGSVGRELAPREMGAMLGQKVGDFLAKRGSFRLSDEDRKLLIAAAAGAGFAGIYISPITGMFFCIEILYKKVTAKSVAVSLTMASIATLIGSLSRGFVPYYLVGDCSFGLEVLPLVLLIGPVTGLVGAGFRIINKRAGERKPTDRKIFAWLPVAALITAVIAVFFPQIMGNGRALAQLVYDASNPTAQVALLLAFGCVSKIAVTLFTLRAGAYGGTLAPSIGAGSAIGWLLGVAYLQIVPGAGLVECALLGSVGLLTATQAAPLMAMAMMFEICHLDYSALLPFALAAALSIAVSTQVQKAFENRR